MRALKALSIALITVVGYVVVTGQVSLYYVVTGSMEPSIPVGSLVIAVRDSGLSAGDVVVYRLENAMLLHRVAEVGVEGVVVSADASPDYVEYVSWDRVVGKMVLAIPLLGYLYLGSLIIPMALAALISVILLPGRGGGLGFWTATASVMAMAFVGSGGLTVIGRPLAVGLAAAMTASTRFVEVKSPELGRWAELSYTLIFVACILSISPQGLLLVAEP